ncbi:MFS transporter [Natranaeroarchaeum aerophilus]|uniref:MFS transporter n=1 Tax=Natranaeroarchaeum aerophilus TaxID=2917711 RepID=A0AAE3K616_9EURY|nr:MFS transporter [Natranaeroarchaeum aerophilus]MCL9814528.1 MFS transporter [Natranaeroarchaeum aerophilus]
MRWRYRETVLALVTLAFFVTMVGRLAISPVVPEITTEFEVSNAFVGAALTGMWLTYAFAQFPSGLLADRYGERPIVLASIAGTGLTSILVVTAPTFGVFFLGTVSLGVMAGLHYSVATTLLSRTYDDNLGTAVGVHNSGAPIAGLVTPVVVSWVAIRYGWRPAVAITAIVAIPATLLFARYVRPTEPQRPDQRMRGRLELGPIVELLSRPKIAFTAVIALVADFTWQGLASFLPTFFAVHRGHSATLAGVVFAAYFVVQGILQIWVGSLADRYGRDRAIALCFGTAILGIALLVGVPGPAGLVAGILLLGLGMGWGAAVFPRFMDNLSADEQGAGFGLVRTVYMIVASTGSVVVGLLADLFGWAVSFGALIGLLGIVLVLVVANIVFDLGY